MEEPFPWFPIWGFDHGPTESVEEIVAKFIDTRPSNRWGLIRDGVIASDRHAWAAWGMLRRLEFRGDCIARNPDTEFLRIISGTGQIAEAIKRSGLSVGEVKAWLFFLPADGTGSPLSGEGISTEFYNEHSDRANHLIASIGGELLPNRPVPSRSGLHKIRMTEYDGGYLGLEEAFLLHLSNSIIN